jgi:hypothetical protein
MSTPASVVLGATAGGAAPVAAAPTLSTAGITLPSAGSGGPAVAPSLTFLMLTSLLAMVGAGVMWMLGRRPQHEDDGIIEIK